MRVLSYGFSVAGGALGGGLLSAYMSPYVARVGHGVPAGLANAGVGGGLIWLGLKAEHKYGRKSPVPLFAAFLSASVPWFITALQEFGVLSGGATEVPVPPQAPGATTEGWAMHGGLYAGRIPGMNGGLLPGRIPGGLSGDLRMERVAVN